jgi:hypothetical protein
MWGFTWKNKEKMDHVMCDQLCWNKKKKKKRILTNQKLRYWSDVQNGTASIAKCSPRADTGVVDNSIAASTAGN